MDVAIIGAGFSGLAVTWHLLDINLPVSNLTIHLFDAESVGGGASGIAAGLLHPFVGAHAKLNWRGVEGMEATQSLLKVASSELGKSVAAEDRGILRLAQTKQQQEDFFLCSRVNPANTQWLTASQCQNLVPGCAEVPGLLIPGGMTIYSSLYIEGLWRACENKGARFFKRKIFELKELDAYDLTIITAGAGSLQFAELKNLSFKGIKGQVLELAWKPQWEPLSCALNSQVYVVMTEHQTSCLVGATYEKKYSHEEIDFDMAKRELLHKAYAIFPPLRETSILNCKAGIRCITPERRPLMKQISHSKWVLAGLGSKGLLYHALLAQELVQNIKNLECV